MERPLVSVVIVNCDTTIEFLQKVWKSVKRQDYPALEFIMTDNGSTNGSDKYVAENFPEVRIIRLTKNLGFPAGVNKGVRQANGKYVFLLNPDTELEASAISEMVNVIEGREGVIGVAPKMLFLKEKSIIDSIGNCMDYYASSFNIGIGQCDIGQYDVTEELFGACFGAALIRRDGFSEEKVGPMDERFFAYYEDTDWCVRANLLGYRFLSAPKAVVYHFHSGYWRFKPYSRKHVLIERNLLRMTFKNFRIKNVLRIYMRKWRNHFKAMLVWNGFRIASLQILLSSLIDMPLLVADRLRIQRRRNTDDRQIFKYFYGERPHYAPMKYEPTYSLDAMHDMYKRLYLITGNKKYFSIYTFVKEMNLSKFRYEIDAVKKALNELLQGEPPAVLDFVDKLKVE